MRESAESAANESEDKAAGAVPAQRIVDSADLLGREKSVWIRHNRELYRLSVTRQGKLILTK